jgi:phenylacetate-CoA ligase
MDISDELRHAPWGELIRRARESGPQFIVRYLQMLRRHRCPQECIHRYQERRLERIVRHAQARVPAYRTVSAQAISSRRMGGLQALAQFPLLDRQALLDNWERYQADNARCYSPRLVQTGGTTGKPVRLYLAGRTRALWNMMSLLRYQWAGWRAGDRTVIFGTSYGDRVGTIPAEVAYRVDEARRHLFLNGVRMTTEQVVSFARMTSEFDPQFIRGYPSLLVLLAREVHALGLRVRPRAVLTGAELLGEPQRDYLTQTFGCPVFDWYNMWENVATAIQCERGTYHCIPELSYVEIVRNGRPAQPGEVGEIVGTHLENYAMPLIRYNMNDLASPIGSPCECGRNLQSITFIGGKGRDLIVTPRGFAVLSARQVTATLDPPIRIEKLQFYQERKEEVLIRIVRGAGHDEDDTRRLLAQIDRMLEGAVILRSEYVDDIPRTPSGKFPYVVCKVPLEL